MPSTATGGKVAEIQHAHADDSGVFLRRDPDMPTKEELDQALAEFLASQRKAEREGNTIAKLRADVVRLEGTVKTLTNQVTQHEGTDKANFDALSRKIDDNQLFVTTQVGNLKSDVKGLHTAASDASTVAREAQDSVENLEQQAAEARRIELEAKLAEVTRAKAEADAAEKERQKEARHRFWSIASPVIAAAITGALVWAAHLALVASAHDQQPAPSTTPSTPLTAIPGH